jgi:hypothetical protein
LAAAQNLRNGREKKGEGKERKEKKAGNHH